MIVTTLPSDMVDEGVNRTVGVEEKARRVRLKCVPTEGRREVVDAIALDEILAEERERRAVDGLKLGKIIISSG